MCPQIATKEQCLNPKHSPSDHGEKKTGKVINFLTVTCHKEEVEEPTVDKGKVEDEEEEGWSYDVGDMVMCLMQRTARQLQLLTPTMKIRAERN